MSSLIADKLKGKEKTEEEKKAEADKKAAKKKKKKAENFGYRLRPGDYTIHVHIIEACEIKGKDNSGTSDPVCTVECMGQKQSTPIYKQTSSVYFDNVMVFEFTNVSLVQLKEEGVLISMWDANTIQRNVFIGKYRFDISKVYYNKHHELFKQWVALTDPSNIGGGIQAYLKASVAVLGPDDEHHVHSKEEAQDDNDGMVDVLMPPIIEQHAEMLKIKVFRFENLPQMDMITTGSKVQPLLKVIFNGQKVKTKKVEGQDVTCNKEIHLPVIQPAMSTTIVCLVMDWDIPKDELISAFRLDYDDIKDRPEYYKHRWINLYGAPRGHGKKISKKMNQGYVEGSCYRGRVLIGAEVICDIEEPVLEILCCDSPPDIDEAKFRIAMDLYEGVNIPKVTVGGIDIGMDIAVQKLYVELSIGNKIIKSSKKKCKDKTSRIKWYNTYEIFPSFPEDTSVSLNKSDYKDDESLLDAYKQRYSQVPDLFIYLCHDGKHLSYKRYSMAELMLKMVKNKWNLLPEWISLQECKSLDALDDDEFPGSLLVGLRVNIVGDKQVPSKLGPKCRPWKSSSKYSNVETTKDEGYNSKKSSNKPKVSTMGSLQVKVIKASKLPIKDKNYVGKGGSSDPFVKVKIAGQKHKTPVIKKNLNPEWNSNFTFNAVKVEDPLNIEVIDEDKLGDDSMGKLIINLKEEQRAANKAAGKDFKFKKEYSLDCGKHTGATILLQVKFTYISVEEAEAEERRAQEEAARKSSSGLFKNILSTAEEPLDYSKLGNPDWVEYELRAHIYSARSLPAVDNNGLCDPFLVIRLSGERFVTPKRSKTLNPKWYKTFSKMVRLQELKSTLTLAPNIEVCVFDYDRFGSRDFIGRCSIPCQQIRNEQNPLSERNPKWYHLLDFSDKKVGGRILACFELLNPQEKAKFQPPHDIRPETTPMMLEIMTLGMRDLTSPIGVHKAKVEFELPNGKKYGTDVSVHPSKKNPNYSQLLKLPVELPVLPIFEPVLEITARDVVMGGLISRRLGSTYLMLTDYLQENSNGLLTEPKESEWQLYEDSKYEDYKKKMEEEKYAPQETPSNAYDEKETKTENEPVRVRVKQSKGYAKMEEEEVESSPPEETDEKKTKNKDKNFDEEIHLLEFGEKYKKDDIVPPYMMMGNKRRAILDDELEDDKTRYPYGLSPFQKIPFKIGQGKSERVSGYYKGVLRLVEPDSKRPPLCDLNQFLNPKKYYVRLYILQGIMLSPKDRNGTSDPYLIVRMGKKKISTRKRYIRNSINPGFYEYFEFPCQLPGAPSIEIKVMDWDGIGDDFIGATSIDIEDRWLNPSWQREKLHPVERRTLRNPVSRASQGKLELWVDVLDTTTAKAIPAHNIVPPPPMYFELRVIIWSVKDCACKDTITNQNDLYATCSINIDGVKRQKTDTHYRSQTGKGNFNWRMKFPVQFCYHKPKFPRLKFHVWDRDLIGSNDSIGEQVVSIKSLCRKAMKKRDRVSHCEKGDLKFWLTNLKDINNPGQKPAKMLVSIELVPSELATKEPAGLGRSDPNCNPFLHPPEGRLNLSIFHPLDMIKDLLGDRLYYKLGVGCCIFIVIAGCVMVMPMMFSNVFARIITG